MRVFPDILMVHPLSCFFENPLPPVAPTLLSGFFGHSFVRRLQVFVVFLLEEPPPSLPLMP